MKKPLSWCWNYFERKEEANIKGKEAFVGYCKFCQDRYAAQPDLVTQEKIIAEPNAARMFRQLIEAIQYLHERNVAHRDIKLENVFLDEKCDVKLADFGFARVISRAEKSTSFCGTKNYSSPSILRSKPYDAFAADWYAAGVVLYAMITGKMPCNPIEKQERNIVGTPFPENVPSLSARYLIERLLTEDELVRAGYEEILDSEWIRTHTNGKWIMADKHFVYEVLDSPKVLSSMILCRSLSSHSSRATVCIW